MRSGELLLEPGNTVFRKLRYLLDSPGVDPIIAFSEGDVQAIPPAGILIAAEITVGSPKAQLDLYRYDAGRLAFTDVSDLRFTTGEVSAEFSITGGARTKLICTPQAITNPSGEWWTLSSETPVIHSAGDRMARRFARTDYLGLNPARSKWAEQPTLPLYMHWAVPNAKEAIAVGRAIGKSMGLNGYDLNDFVAAYADQLTAISPDQRLDAAAVTRLQQAGATIINLVDRLFYLTPRYVRDN